MSGEHWEDLLEIIGPECYERFLSHENVPELAPIGVRIAGVSQLAGHYKIAHRKPDSHTLLYTVSGRGKLSTPNGIKSIEPNSLTFLPIAQPFIFEIDADQWSTAWFCVEDQDQWAFLRERPASIEYCEKSQVIYHLMCVLYYEGLEEDRRLPFQQLNRHLRETLANVRQQYSQVNRVETLFAEIEKQLHRSWTIDEMAAVCHYSPSHLHRLCLKIYGRSPKQQLIHLRIKRGQHLLTLTDWNLTQIATALGYQDVFNFSNRFKKSTGKSPTEYRKQRR